MKAIYPISINTYREAVRGATLPIILFNFIILNLLFLLLGTITAGSKIEVVKDAGLFFTTFCSVVAVSIVGNSLFKRELEEKTIYNILSKPVQRYEFIIGKVFGLTLFGWLIALLSGTALFFALFLLNDPDLLRLPLGIYFSSLELIIIAGFSVMMSSFTETKGLTGLLCFLLYIIGHSIEYIQKLANEIIPNKNLADILTTITNFLPDFRYFNVNEALVYGDPITSTMLINRTIYSIGLTIATIIIGIIFFNRRAIN